MRKQCAIVGGREPTTDPDVSLRPGERAFWLRRVLPEFGKAEQASIVVGDDRGNTVASHTIVMAERLSGRRRAGSASVVAFRAA